MWRSNHTNTRVCLRINYFCPQIKKIKNIACFGYPFLEGHTPYIHLYERTESTPLRTSTSFKDTKSSKWCCLGGPVLSHRSQSCGVWKEELPSSVCWRAVVRQKWHLWLCDGQKPFRGGKSEGSTRTGRNGTWHSPCAYPAMSLTAPLLPWGGMGGTAGALCKAKNTKVHLCPCSCPPEFLLFKHRRGGRYVPSPPSKGAEKPYFGSAGGTKDAYLGFCLD